LKRGLFCLAIALSGCAAMALSGCAAPGPLVLSVDPRITVIPQSGVVVANPPTITTDAHGITDVAIELRNPSPRAVAVNCVVDWFERNGQPAGGLSAQPARIAVAPYAAEFCRTVSPDPGARVFRAAINPAF
jgi:hypothetical protein